jgi:hypothetical protein
MQIFGAKLGFGIHYYHTGKIVPETGGVVVQWFPNYHIAAADIPFEIFDGFPPSVPLRQDEKHSVGQFEYSCMSVTGGIIGMYRAIFRKSFAIFVGVADDLENLPDGRLIHRPFQ